MAAVRDRVSDYLSRLAYLILPPLEVDAAKRKLDKRSLKSLQELEQTDHRYSDWYGISVPKLDELIKAEGDRAAKLDDKAGKISAVLAVALAIGGTFGVSLVEKVSLSLLRTSMRIALLLAIIYILMGGWLALFSGNSAKPEGGYGPDWEARLSKEKSMDKQPRVEALVNFEIANLIRNNNISGALQCIRNGAALFFFVLLLAVADPMIPICIGLYENVISLIHCGR